VTGGTCPFLIDSITSLRRECPEATVELITRSKARELFDDLRVGRVAMLYTGLGPRMDDLEQQAIARSRWVVLTPRNKRLVDRDHVTVEDLDSKNGTSIGGKRIRGLHTLSDGDSILFGTVAGMLRAVRPVPSTETAR